MIYLDNAATTKVYDEILPIVSRYLTAEYFNPSALYSNSVTVACDIKRARSTIAAILGVEASTLHFTSSGTESDNQALFCSKKRKGARIIISAAEHAAVYNAAMELKQQGYDIAVCPVKADGSVDDNAFCALLNEDTALVSIMHVNNETGAINDIEKLVNITKNYNKSIVFHSDGVQAYCKIPLNLNKLGVDLYSISGHKIGAPKGIAALYVKKGVHVAPMLFGGGQESGLRASTENVAGIMALEAASRISISKLPELRGLSVSVLGELRRELAIIEGLIVITPEHGAPHILTLALPDVRGEVIMHALEMHGIIVGIGSACSSKKGVARLPQSIGLSERHRQGVIRLSISCSNSPDDASRAAEAIIAEYKKLSAYKRG